jgi:hypothetical protein
MGLTYPQKQRLGIMCTASNKAPYWVILTNHCHSPAVLNVRHMNETLEHGDGQIKMRVFVVDVGVREGAGT